MVLTPILYLCRVTLLSLAGHFNALCGMNMQREVLLLFAWRFLIMTTDIEYSVHFLNSSNSPALSSVAACVLQITCAVGYFANKEKKMHRQIYVKCCKQLPLG
jgi:fucose 4-O-acetylase-like acetyltransferase